MKKTEPVDRKEMIRNNRIELLVSDKKIFKDYPMGMYNLPLAANQISDTKIHSGRI